jgi:hypothetical protein
MAGRLIYEKIPFCQTTMNTLSDTRRDAGPPGFGAALRGLRCGFLGRADDQNAKSRDNRLAIKSGSRRIGTRVSTDCLCVCVQTATRSTAKLSVSGWKMETIGQFN